MVDDIIMNEDDFFITEYHDPDCGRAKGRGRPKRGWVKVEAEAEGRWYCGWDCVRQLAEDKLQEGRPS